MPRTTLNIDGPILRDLKRLQRREGKSLGRLVSDLLAEVIGHNERRVANARSFRWVSRPMVARVDLTDKDAIRAAMEEDNESKPSDAERL